MKVGQWSWVFNNVKTHLDFKTVMGISRYLTTFRAATLKAITASPIDELFRRISPLGNPSISIVPILDQWVAEGKPVDKKHHLQLCIKLLRQYKRYSRRSRYFPLAASDVAVRLDLIGKTHGLKDAENYFNSVPKQLKGLEVYSSLLHCYGCFRSVEKAEAVMQRMRDLGLDRCIVASNSLLTLYYKTGNYKKLDTFRHEMEEKGIAYNAHTYCICLSAYAAQCNVDGINNILQKAESDRGRTLPWNFYTVATYAYIKVGHMDKALAMLKKFEALSKGNSGAYNQLLRQYATLGKKEDVLRVWELYKTNMKVYNKGYLAMISSLLKFDDIESAEKIFDEWESHVPATLRYDIRIPNLLLGAYSRKGLLEKFERIVNQIILKEGKPNARTWYFFAKILLMNNEMGKAVNAMKEAILISQPWWKPCDESLAACLKYLKEEGEIDEAEKLINLLVDKDIISSEVQVKLLSYVKDGNVDSTLDGLVILDGSALHQGGEEADDDGID
ncbi:hypothetical protein COLO4_29446 [Corchorus olitorius]|uniref:Tetratricopeptide-like helical n=1 Tax=Corchorus olitorius TaxID=93759 RepID=A0A1R3HEJ9_9ROSI|nr:hypothetical protein COLO4_29446 [Corchorus olitorius]